MIAVISDSHVPARSPGIPEEFLEVVEEADLTVHCGDFETREVYERVEDRSEKLVAVKGNCDRFELPNSERFEREGVRLGVYHGTGIHPRGDPETLQDIAENKLEVDILLHGHTHRQEAERRDDIILLNPGSCTGVGGGSSRTGNPRMLTLEPGKELEVRLLELSDGEIIEKKKSYNIKG